MNKPDKKKKNKKAKDTHPVPSIPDAKNGDSTPHQTTREALADALQDPELDSLKQEIKRELGIDENGSNGGNTPQATPIKTELEKEFIAHLQTARKQGKDVKRVADQWVKNRMGITSDDEPPKTNGTTPAHTTPVHTTPAQSDPMAGPKPGYYQAYNNYAATHLTAMEMSNFVTTGHNRVYMYNGTYWQRVKHRGINQLLKENSFQYKRRNATHCVIPAIEMECYQPDLTWNQINANEIPFENGLLNIANGLFRPHRREDYLDSVNPIHYFEPLEGEDYMVPNCPIWYGCLEDWFGKDEDGQQKVRALQEFMGYALLSHARYKKALLCIGPSNSGKSVINHVMSHMVGLAHCCQIPLQQLGDEMRLAQLQGKRLNVISEVNASISMDDAGFKQVVSTGDPIQFKEQYGTSEMLIPYCKHALFANTMPQINDSSKGVYNRLLVIEMNHVIPSETQDPMLFSKLRDELNAIALWATEGAKRLLKQNGHFTEVPSSEDFLDHHYAANNPLLDFIQTYCQPAKKSFIKMEHFRQAFYRVTGENEKSYTVNQIGRDLKNANFRNQSRKNKKDESERRLLGLAWNSLGKKLEAEVIKETPKKEVKDKKKIKNVKKV